MKPILKTSFYMDGGNALDLISLERLQQGDQDELKLFFNRYFPVFVLFATNYVENRQVCEDIVQEAFVAFWQKQETFKNMYYVRAFLYKLVRNKCLNHLRHLKARAGFEEKEGREKAGVESTGYFIDSIIKEEASRIVCEALEHLSPVGREVIEWAMEGLSNQEIAEKMGISVNTVRTHKARSYPYLRSRLSELRILLFLI